MHDMAGETCPALGLVTVDRTLEALEEIGLIQSIGRKTGYQITEHWLQLFGLCADCR